MGGALFDDQLGRYAGLFELRDENLRWLDRNEFVSIAMNDERRGIVIGDVVDRRDAPADLDDSFVFGDGNVHVVDLTEFLKAKRGSKGRQCAATEAEFSLLAIVEEIGRRKEACDRLHPA